MLFVGVNTGFGGSADTRTREELDLQAALLQHLQVGILTSNDRDHGTLLTDSDPLAHAMRESWVKGMILIRCNTLARGHSAVSFKVIESLNALLVNNVVPLVPLRAASQPLAISCHFRTLLGF